VNPVFIQLTKPLKKYTPRDLSEMAEQDCASPDQDCGSAVEHDRSPEPSLLKRLRSSPTLCTPHREEKRVPLRELIANEACSEVPRVTLFNPPSAPEGGSCDPTYTQQVKFPLLYNCK